jgi:DNA repair exonuclease SbcCD ATPase subunit
MLLKDSGIKSSIIKQYLPIMNHLINKYLQALDLFVQFELDETFSERIRSRFRDDFSYTSFSEGEKARINIAILFAWREIARLKNSVNTNLLVMDEVLDSSLDEQSLENFMGLISDLRNDVNLFIISHRNTLSERFDHTIHVKKHNDFSYVKHE